MNRFWNAVFGAEACSSLRVTQVDFVCDSALPGVFPPCEVSPLLFSDSIDSRGGDEELAWENVIHREGSAPGHGACATAVGQQGQGAGRGVQVIW